MSGAAVYSPWVESKVMREYAVALGVPREDVLIDDRAGARTGFDLPLYRDILLLIGIALEKKRLNQLDEPQAGIREVASAGTPFPAIETGACPAPVLTEGGAIDFAPLEFNFNTESETDSAGRRL